MSRILDDPGKIMTIDKGGMCSIQMNFPEYCEDAIERSQTLVIPKHVTIRGHIGIKYGNPEKIIVAGMGGSAIGGNLLKDWLRERLPIPITVCRDYQLPAYADAGTLVFASSYSGNTEETLSMFLDALERRCMTIALTSNGQLLQYSRSLGLPYVKLPLGYPPRSALPYLFFPLVIALKKLGILRGVDDEITEAITVLKRVREEIGPQNPTEVNLAKQIAQGVEGSIPLVCGFGQYEGVALRIKTQFNENSKTPAKVEFFSEMNHNETVGWTGLRELTKHFSVILIRDDHEPLEIKTRIELTKELVFNSGARGVFEIFAKGNSVLSRMLSTMYIGDLISVYLGVLYGFDPTPVEIIDEFKQRLEERVKKGRALRTRFEAIIGESP